MRTDTFPSQLKNWINGEEKAPATGGYFDNLNPHDGSRLCEVARSGESEVNEAVQSAKAAQEGWAELTPVRRGQILNDLCDAMRNSRETIAQIVAQETGKSMKAALGETDGGTALGRFFAGEGQRLFGRTMTSGVPNKYAMTIRTPVGVAGVVVPANTPIANVAWKIFPALICGNSVVLKSSEDSPGTAWIVGKLAQEVGLPAGVLNIVHGFGQEAGERLVQHSDVGVISFTGSTAVGKRIASIGADRLAKVSLELGGKNPLLVCDDADMDNAINWTILSAFSNAGQRCASGSRIIVAEKIYDTFKEKFLSATADLKLGIADDDDLGPVINERQLSNMLTSIEKAKADGATILIGGQRAQADALKAGSYMCPTILEGVSPEDEISNCELFGPIAILYKVSSYQEGLDLANRSEYGLTAAIHTSNFNRAVHFTHNVQSGVAVVNGGTFGSEPHMPFGGVKQSGNGTREPGTEALDIYSELRAVHHNILPGKLD